VYKFVYVPTGHKGGAIYARSEAGTQPISFVLSGCVFDGNQANGPFNATDPILELRGGGGAIFSMSK